MTIREAGKILQGFIPKGQAVAISEGLAGEESEYFEEKVFEMADLIQTMPKNYEQEGKEGGAIAYLHYFKGGMDWWITEKDRETPDEPGQHQAFGLADLGFGQSELGYISIVELIGNGVELDLHFTLKPLNEIRPNGQ